MPLSLRALRCLLASTAMAACTDGARTSESWSTSDSAGVSLVRSTTPAWPPNSGWRVGASDLELGAGGTKGPSFADVGFVSLMSDGRVVVTDVGADAVVLFDPVTGAARTIARKGGGPGEVLQVSEAWVARGDTIITWDFGNRRVQFFAPDGQYVRAVSLDARVLGAGAFPIGPLPDGHLLFVSRTGQVATDLPPGRDSARYLRLTSDSLRVRDTVAVLPDLERYTVPLTFGGQEANQRQVMPFGRSTDVSTTPAGFLVADNATWEVREYDAEGRVKTIVRRDLSPEPITPDDVSEYRRRFEEVMRRDKSLPPELVSQLIADSRDAPHAATMPTFVGAVKGRDGSIWVRHYDLLERDTAETFAVVAPSGRYLGDVTLPNDTKLMAVGDEYVLLVGSSADGSPVVRRHALIK